MSHFYGSLCISLHHGNGTANCMMPMLCIVFWAVAMVLCDGRDWLTTVVGVAFCTLSNQSSFSRSTTCLVLSLFYRVGLI